MKPDKGQRVKLFMRHNSILLEGIVENWSDEQVILKSLEDDGLILVNRPSEDIMIVKITAAQVQIDEQKQLPEIKAEITETLRETLKPEIEPEIESANLKQLRKLAVLQDRKIIAEKSKQHFGTAAAPKEIKHVSQFDILKGK